MKVEHLRVNHLNKPIGYHLEHLTFSWKVKEAKDVCSNQVQLLISKVESMQEPVYDSGIRQDYSFSQMEVEVELTPRTRYFWKVIVSTKEDGTQESEISWFETGKMQEKWEADWIGVKDDKTNMPILYRDFPVEKPIMAAKIYIFGAGLYEAYVNGAKISDEYLMPGYHAYDLLMEYQTFDITENIILGENRISVLLGEGWYKGRFGFDGEYYDLYGNQKKLIAEIRIEYADGRMQVIKTDQNWNAKTSAILENGIYDGEIQDDTLEPAELQVEVLTDSKDLLTERTSLPLHKTEEFKPVSWEWNHDYLLLDFGESITGWVEMEGTLAYGQKIRLQYGEVLQNGAFYRENLRTAKAEFCYTSDGSTKLIRPHFTYYGFRYVKVEGLKKEQELSFTAYRLMSDIEETGKIETSNELVNRLLLNTKRSQKCNFLDIPTDCPQRDERMGWTGDVNIFANTACFHMDCSAFFAHYARTLYEEQKLLKGAVPFFAPRPKVPVEVNTNPFYLDSGACIWSDVAAMLPWTLFNYYADKGLLKEQYPMMKLWVDYMKERSSQNAVPYLWQNDRHLGDWLALDNGNIHNPIGKTDMGFLASLFYCWSAQTLAKAGRSLGLEESAEYEKLSLNIKEAFIAYYFSKDGKMQIETTQTACALLLYTGLYPACAEEYLKRELKQLIEDAGGHLNTGFAGTPFLCPALSKSGMNSLAYDLLLIEDYPGWLHEVKLGATTVWERWNSLDENEVISGTGMNSLNHYAYGSIADWMYRYMCGLKPQTAEEIRMVIAPMPDDRLKYVKGSWESLDGTYVCEWKYIDKQNLTYYVEIPFNAKAEMIFPNGRRCILEKGKYCFNSNGECI